MTDPRLHVLNLVAGDPSASGTSAGSARLEGMFHAIEARDWVAVAWFPTEDRFGGLSVVWAGRVDRRSCWDLNVSAADWTSGELDVLDYQAREGFAVIDQTVDDWDQAFPSIVYLDVLGWTDTGHPFVGRAKVYPTDGGRGYGLDWELVDAWWQS